MLQASDDVLRNQALQKLKLALLSSKLKKKKKMAIDIEYLVINIVKKSILFNLT